jgi:hypothetical protein
MRLKIPPFPPLRSRIGYEPAATRLFGEQAKLLILDTIRRLATRSVDCVVDHPRQSVEIRCHEARVCSLSQVFRFQDHTAPSLLTFRTVFEFVDVPLLLTGSIKRLFCITPIGAPICASRLLLANPTI